MEVSGLEEVRAALTKGGRAVAERFKPVLVDAAERAKAIQEATVPVEHGALKASLRVGRPTYTEARDSVSVALIVGGDVLLEGWQGPLRPGESHGRTYNIYAVVQEFKDLHHDSGQAHAGEVAVTAVAPTIPDALLAAVEPGDVGGA